MGGEVLVPLLVSPVLGDAVDGKQKQTTETRISLPSPAGFMRERGYGQVEVVPSDDDGVGHLGRLHNSGKDSASDRDFTGEGALLVYIYETSNKHPGSVQLCADNS